MVILAFGLMIGNAAEPAKTDLPALLQKGLFEEEVNRNFEAAITEYRAALAQFDRQRNYGATALFRLAECLRKTGRKAEADPLYRRVIQEFPDQTNLVQLSHTHLGTAPGVAKVEGVPPAAVLDEEAKEIQRIAAMVKDSPDLINGPKNGVTPLHLAAAKAQLKVAAYLLDHGADIEGKLVANNAVVGAKAGGTPLILAAQAGHKAMVELLVKRGASVEAVDSERNTALHWAAENGFKGVAEVLLEAKASVNAMTYGKTTPLMRAIDNGHKAIVELLLARGAKVNVATQTGDTPLHFAASRGHLELAKFLLAAKADIHIKNANGETPLHRAVGENKQAMVTLLCEAGARVNEADNRGFTPLLLAIQKNEEAVDLLLRYKADPNAALPSESNVNKIGRIQKPTALMFAVGVAQPTIAQKLVDHGADVNARDANGATPLYWALVAANTNAVDLLLRHNADPRIARTDSGHTPLHFAATRGNTDVVRWLLDHKAEINAQDREGQTALYVATNYRFKEVVTLLLERGADAMLATKNGTTPMDLVAPAAGGPMAPPTGRTVTFPPPTLAPGQPVSPTFTTVQGSAEELQEILRKHGVSLLTPRPGMIMVGRVKNNTKSWVIPENTNRWNRLTLLEVITESYNQNNPQRLPFPDWEKVRIFRRVFDDKIREIPVNVEEILRGRSGDLQLTWGDVVDIPEKEHLASERWQNLNPDHLILNKMLTRAVTVNAKGLTNEVQFAPFQSGGTIHPLAVGGAWLGQFLKSRPNLYLTTSDLTRVRVRRIERPTGERVEYLVDATKLDPRTDLWLRHWDEIIIPEKGF